MGNSSRNKNNLQNAHGQSIQSVSYRGLLPPPDMMEQFKKLDPGLPERIVRMAERSFDMADKELDIIAAGGKPQGRAFRGSLRARLPMCSYMQIRQKIQLRKICWQA